MPQQDAARYCRARLVCLCLGVGTVTAAMAPMPTSADRPAQAHTPARTPVRCPFADATPGQDQRPKPGRRRPVPDQPRAALARHRSGSERAHAGSDRSPVRRRHARSWVFRACLARGRRTPGSDAVGPLAGDRRGVGLGLRTSEHTDRRRAQVARQPAPPPHRPVARVHGHRHRHSQRSPWAGVRDARVNHRCATRSASLSSSAPGRRPRRRLLATFATAVHVPSEPRSITRRLVSRRRPDLHGWRGRGSPLNGRRFPPTSLRSNRDRAAWDGQLDLADPSVPAPGLYTRCAACCATRARARPARRRSARLPRPRCSSRTTSATLSRNTSGCSDRMICSTASRAAVVLWPSAIVAPSSVRTGVPSEVPV